MILAQPRKEKANRNADSKGCADVSDGNENNTGTCTMGRWHHTLAKKLWTSAHVETLWEAHLQVTDWSTGQRNVQCSTMLRLLPGYYWLSRFAVRIRRKKQSRKT